MDLIHRIIQILLLTFLFSSASGQSDKRVLPGPQGYLLPNGWTLTPAGKQIEVGDLPMNIVVEPSGRHAFVLNSGWNEHTVSVIDLGHNRKIQEVSLYRSWLGLCFDPRERRLYVSGGARPIIEVLAYDPTHQEAPLAKQAPIALDSTLMKKVYISGLALDTKGKRLFAANTEEGTLIEVDLKSGRTLRRLSLGGVPYTCLLSKDGQTVYVSLWNRKGIALVDRVSWTVRKTIAVGSHPNDLAMTADGQRLFVANANSNSVSVVALKKEKVSETIVTTLFPKAPQGSTPNALAISPDGQTLFVANATITICLGGYLQGGRERDSGLYPNGLVPIGRGGDYGRGTDSGRKRERNRKLAQPSGASANQTQDFGDRIHWQDHIGCGLDHPQAHPRCSGTLHASGLSKYSLPGPAARADET